MQLVATNGQTDLWLDLAAFLATMGVGRVRGRMVLCDKSGNFRVRVGIQTYDTDAEVPNAPAAVTRTSTGTGYLSTVNKAFIDFDPTLTGNGVIDTKAGFRLGVLYSSTDATVSRGDVLVELWIDA